MATTIFAPALLLLLGSPLAPSLPSSPHVRTSTTVVEQPVFDKHWFDGQAEVNGYRWKGSRYGQMRTGEAIGIFVTEQIGARDHVKVDRPKDYSGERLNVMKLNLVRTFQTGIYDYKTMSTTYADVAEFRPVKATFSSAEWCGHVFESLDVRARDLRLAIDSYFQGESRVQELETKPNAILGDQLLVWIRGLRILDGHVLAPGESKSFPYIADAFERRLRHTEAAWTELTLTRSAANSTITVAAGKFEAVEFRLRCSDGREGAVQLENAYPHRLLAWSWSRGAEILDSGELAGSQRMKYWELHDEGQESLRKSLGLSR